MQEHCLPMRPEGYRPGDWQGVRQRGWSLGMQEQVLRPTGMVMGMHQILKQQSLWALVQVDPMWGEEVKKAGKGEGLPMSIGDNTSGARAGAQPHVLPLRAVQSANALGEGIVGGLLEGIATTDDVSADSGESCVGSINIVIHGWRSISSAATIGAAAHIWHHEKEGNPEESHLQTKQMSSEHLA